MYLKLFHLSVVALNVFAIFYDQMYVDLPFPCRELEELPFKARHIFLTVWCLVLQTVYFAISFLNDCYGTNEAFPKKLSLIRQIKDVVFSLAFPFAIYVTFAFWSLYTVNKEWIMPEEIEIRMPRWINHTMHTLITVFTFIELLVTRRNYPSRTLGVYLILALTLIYFAWIHVLYFQIGVWVYPFLDLINWPLRVAYFVVSAFISIAVYYLGEKINYLVAPSTRTYYTNVGKKVY